METLVISLTNFDEIAKRYKPLLLKTISATLQRHGRDARLEPEDLMQEALFTLYRAIEKFDPERGVFFGTYLKTAIGHSLSCFARDTLPHRYEKTSEFHNSGQPKFRCVKVQVNSIEEMSA